jgi:hypothetical protein
LLSSDLRAWCERKRGLIRIDPIFTVKKERRKMMRNCNVVSIQ